MTEHQQNRNVCEVGLACEAMTIDPKTIQSAVMRKEATQVVIPHFKGFVLLLSNGLNNAYLAINFLVGNFLGHENGCVSSPLAR
jgi:hypothetical protein